MVFYYFFDGVTVKTGNCFAGVNSRTRRHMWVEFVVGSRPCSERFFSGYSGFPLSSKTNISKFQFTLKSRERDEPIKYVFI